ncbi:MAG: hypothetical protein KJ065_02625 [Anaerolineae bacterium]|nr:hypothetical protein [Anaerolineae bacterium]
MRLSIRATPTAAAPSPTAPVRVEDDVFVGMNCLILKGVTIGAGSGGAADIPPGVIAAGAPAKVVRGCEG